MMLVLMSTLSIHVVYSQKVEVQGELKVTEMTANDIEDNLVIRNTDGTLGTRSVNSLPPPPAPIDTSRNLASDFALAKQLCDCPNLPPFMIKKVLDSGYTPEELVGSGLAVQDVIDAQRGGVLIDPRDNQSYKTVTIGTQTWMAENLNFGTMIPGLTNQKESNFIIEKYCYDDIAANCTIYGGLYQWDEMMQYVTTEGTQGVCPTGWHLPSDQEWQFLEFELGMTQTQTSATGDRGTDQGSQLAGNGSLWLDELLEQNGVFASSGFAVIPGGYRSNNSTFTGETANTSIASSSAFSGSANTTIREFWYDRPTVFRSITRSKELGHSVRCIKD